MARPVLRKPKNSNEADNRVMMVEVFEAYPLEGKGKKGREKNESETRAT